MDNRRSMGMSKPWTQPKRSSITGASSGAAVTLAVPGASKLPKPKTTGPSSSQKPRSSSIDPQSGARRAASATRSPSKTRTPLRASRHLVSVFCPLRFQSFFATAQEKHFGQDFLDKIDIIIKEVVSGKLNDKCQFLGGFYCRPLSKASKQHY